MSTKQLQIHSQNILPIIKRWLYSDRDIFARELIANATDALRKLQVIQGESAEYRIDVRIDKVAKTLTISDNGIGMSSDEVEKYIAQIAFSGAEEFLSHYKDSSEGNHIIGHFGLGFYSAYMVASKVEIQTKSHLADEAPAHWTCAGETEYQLEPGSRAERGTDVILHIGKDAEEYLEESKLRQILTRYCAFLPFSIYLGEARITLGEPLWLKHPRECQTDEYLSFYRKLHPGQQDPLFWIHLDVEFPFTLRGILYFPRVTADFDPARAPIKLFCNRVFVSDNCKEILPEFLMPLQGALDSPDIPLNVSRSSLQMDAKVRQIASHISKKVCDRLRQLHSEDLEKFIEIWPDIQWVVKVGSLQDDKFFDRASDCMIWRSLEGPWLSLAECKSAVGEKAGGKMHYIFQGAPRSPFTQMYLDRQLPVLEAHPLIDPPLFALIERKFSPLQFQRIDSALDEGLLDKGREKTLLDSDGKTQSSKLAELFKAKLNIDKLEVQAKSLQSESVAGIVVYDEQTRRLRDTWLRQNPPQSGKETELSPPWLSPATFVVNTNHALVQLLEKIETKQPDLCREMALHLYELALMTQNELPEAKKGELFTRSMLLMERLARSVA